MSKELIKLEIRKILSEYDNYVLSGFNNFGTFKELSKGNGHWSIHTPDGRDTQIILLANVNDDCMNAFSELRESGEILISPTTLMVAMADMAAYDLPVHSGPNPKTYKSPHWSPSLVSKGPNFTFDVENMKGGFFAEGELPE